MYSQAINTGHSASKSQSNHHIHQRLTSAENDEGPLDQIGKQSKNSIKHKLKSTSIVSSPRETVGQKNSHLNKQIKSNRGVESSLSSSSIDSIGKQKGRSNDKLKAIEGKIKRMEIGANSELNNSNVQKIDDEDDQNQIDTSFDHPPSKKLLTSPLVYSNTNDPAKTDVNMAVSQNNPVDTSTSTNPTDESQTVNMLEQNADANDVNKSDQDQINDVSMNNSNGNNEDTDDGTFSSIFTTIIVCQNKNF